MGYLGSLSQKGLGKIFSKCGFLNLLSPLGLPIPSFALLPAKKLKNFPRGCESGLLFIRAVTLKVDGPDMRVKWWNIIDELEEVRK